MCAVATNPDLFDWRCVSGLQTAVWGARVGWDVAADQVPLQNGRCKHAVGSLSLSKKNSAGCE